MLLHQQTTSRSLSDIRHGTLPYQSGMGHGRPMHDIRHAGSPLEHSTGLVIGACCGRVVALRFVVGLRRQELLFLAVIVGAGRFHTIDGKVGIVGKATDLLRWRLMI